MTFHGKTRMSAEDYAHLHESPCDDDVRAASASGSAPPSPARSASTPSSAEGYKEFWGNAVIQKTEVELNHAMHHELPEWVHWSTFTAMALGTFLPFLYYKLVPSLPAITVRIFYPIYVFLLNKWYFDELYDFIFVRPTFWIANMLWKVGDIGIINGLIDGTAAGVYRITGRAVGCRPATSTPTPSPC